MVKQSISLLSKAGLMLVIIRLLGLWSLVWYCFGLRTSSLGRSKHESFGNTEEWLYKHHLYCKRRTKHHIFRSLARSLRFLGRSFLLSHGFFGHRWPLAKEHCFAGSSSYEILSKFCFVVYVDLNKQKGIYDEEKWPFCWSRNYLKNTHFFWKKKILHFLGWIINQPFQNLEVSTSFPKRLG